MMEFREVAQFCTGSRVIEEPNGVDLEEVFGVDLVGSLPSDTLWSQPVKAKYNTADCRRLFHQAACCQKQVSSSESSSVKPQNRTHATDYKMICELAAMGRCIALCNWMTAT